MRIMAALCCALFIATLAIGQGYVPHGGYVPDSATAVRIAEAVLMPVYGQRQIESERPFTAKLKDGVWTVSGTLHCPDGRGGISTSCNGGVAVVQVSKLDARILSMMHGK
jgi:NTF2 fold immunity protein